MKNYIINESTYAIISLENKTKIIDNSLEIIYDDKAYNIVANNCLYYGSSIEGRNFYSKMNLNSKIKLPIIISEYNNIVLFPTESYKNENCIWFNIDNINIYFKIDKYNVKIIFKNNIEMVINISFYIFKKQYLLAAALKLKFFQQK